MSETRRFREDAVRIVRDTGKPIAQVARDLDCGVCFSYARSRVARLVVIRRRLPARRNLR
jgi:hypothetical protein